MSKNTHMGRGGAYRSEPFFYEHGMCVNFFFGCYAAAHLALFFLFCHAATQLPLQLHQERTQVLCSNGVAQKRPARRHFRNGP